MTRHPAHRWMVECRCTTHEPSVFQGDDHARTLDDAIRHLRRVASDATNGERAGNYGCDRWGEHSGCPVEHGDGFCRDCVKAAAMNPCRHVFRLRNLQTADVIPHEYVALDRSSDVIVPAVGSHGAPA